MWSMLKQFDAYTLRARIFPALIAGLPTLALLFVMVPWDRLGISHVVATTMSLVLLFAFADVARRTGRIVEAKLETRATPELWHHDNLEIDAITKDRYREFMAAKLKKSAPTAEDEVRDIKHANHFYLSAGHWLRDNTRDTKKFKILFDELLTYGFRRNLLGLKPVALILNAVVLALTSAALYSHWEYSAIQQTQEKLILIVAVVVLHSAYMIFAVHKEAVRDASKSYGKQLIFSCETLMKGGSVAPAKSKAKATQ